MSNVDPHKVILRQCEINGIDYTTGAFHVVELRVFEDICKTYFTAQLVIETTNNIGEELIQPTLPVIISFAAPRTIGGVHIQRPYTESFRIYSYQSSPIGDSAASRMQHTLSLIGQEYYNDRHNTVMLNVTNRPGTEAVKDIHNQYIGTNGLLQINSPSTGLIGQQYKPHEVKNKKPVKAIFDILDRCVFANYPTCAPTYFRNKRGYVIAPLQQLLESGPINNEKFIHAPASGGSMWAQRQGYNLIDYIAPVAPAGESSAGVTAGDISKMFTSSSFFDFKTGNYIKGPPIDQSQANILSQFTKSKVNINQLLQSVKRGSGALGARLMHHTIDELMQSRSVDKHGPGQYNIKQEAFLTTLNYMPKFRVSVPMQSGIFVTCGDRIDATYLINQSIVQHVFFVPRLIHEVKFTTGPDRKSVEQNGCTEMYCVLW